MIREILSFGAVALGGGYLAKRYWDKKKAEERIDKIALYDYGCEMSDIRQFCRLKSSRHKTHKILANLADKICALGDFDESLKLLKSYTAHNELDLDGFIALDKNEANKIATIFPIVGFLESMICEMLKAKERWLDEIAQSLGKSLPEQTKSEIVALIDIMQSIYMLVLWGNLLRDNKWQNDKLVEARELLVALKSHPSKSSANQN